MLYNLDIFKNLKKPITRCSVLFIFNLKTIFFIYKSRFLACPTQNLESQNLTFPKNLF